MFLDHRLARATALSLLVILGSGPAGLAAGPAKKAVKVLKKETGAALSELKQTTKGLEKVLDANLDVVDLKLKNGNGSKYDVGTVFEALKAYQENLGSAMNSAGGDLRLALLAAQPMLNDAGLTVHQLPKGFNFGDGGICDAYRRSVLAEVDKSLADAEKRVRKTAVLFEKHADVGVLVRLARPRNLIDWPGTKGSTYTPLQHTIGILLSRCALSTPDDGTIYAWGNCYQNDQLQLASNASHGSGISTTVSTSGNKWERTVGDVDSGYHSIKLSVSGVTGGGAYGAIGVR